MKQYKKQLEGEIIIALNKQIHIYSVDTSAFYYENEKQIHKKLNKVYILKSKIKKRRVKIYKQYKKNESENKDNKIYIDNLYKRVNKLLSNIKEKLYLKFDNNKGKTRILNEEHLVDKNVVSIFDSVLTRITGMQINELSKDLIIVQTYFFEILEDIILNEFTYNNERYVVYTASAGQIRTKKTVFIKESVLNEYENTLTCGLTDKVINKRGTININKYLAYRALQNSATDEWIGFDIDKTIVVKDFETNVKTMVDYINDETYEITRVEMDIPIPHTDGCGMMLPSFCNKNRMCRLPWIKGLLVAFDFKAFILENIERYPKCAIVKDIYNKEYDIIKDDIQVILTESQFKMYKYCKSWKEYQDNFKKYNCQVGYCNEEEDFIKNARINYQMLQTLTDITEDELKELSKKTNNDIYKISSDKDTMLKLLGATKENFNKNNLQQSIQYYPQLLNDAYSKDILKQIRKSLVKKAKSAKLSIEAKYTFICPDLYAFSEWLFLGMENPNGLLEKEDVFCSLYSNNKELDCLRSPHLYMEHCVRKNKINEERKKWFTTKALYTSCKDVISKILQFDVDGDKSLVCVDKRLVPIAKRNIEKHDIVPLYYNMKKAGAMKIDRQTIYDGMISAYRGGNIGLYSNDICKIWNSNNIDLNIIKLLCMENNFVIDYAKTLYKPTRPKGIKEKITKYTKSKVPYFFMYAKDKTKEQVEVLNDSVVNKLNKIIKNPNLDFTAIKGRFNYKKLMNNAKIEVDESNQYIIDKYKQLDTKKSFMIDNNGEKQMLDNMVYEYQKVRKEILELNTNVEYVVDVLINYLYCNKQNNKKITLWECFGDIMLNNLKNNLTKAFRKETMECSECGVLIERKSNVTKYCEDCANNMEKENTKTRVRKHRENKM
jgi:arsenate reductase-like glutaredoxin family protein